ncbi:putative hydrolase KNAG_0L01840 [Huiozyma naganishii CBS 8797]|uniref:DUF676 domain-containing protein n=1 Tax=Huiozyma naganishii (strain ATCC MYA-139 / BCRC 22969 / CBS 8797 / KCTC 17520 / NBRC 10181 / NCYC 3082 / Yp74L-3) TaxID=1071383 RepID=J7RSB3_HUIN7|nr:hypothetical protein KNAG_0L01840 [Kazachstania naganishii CBS 8797]CCK72803.1 hypothetical protein KNAG_0L01840 [Kazachstania naganishii CBS 8797]
MSSDKHLFVLVHGLWGTHKHMEPMEEVFRDVIPKDEGIIYFAPRQNAKFKTFDGIEIIGYRTLIELCHFIKSYDGPGKITKISIVGYSLGGLIARFLVGKCFSDCKELFKGIEPQLFITVASPHLGIDFYNRSGLWRGWLLNPFLKFLGTTFLGKSGRELFITNGYNDILVRLSQESYLENLKLFKHRVVFGNVKNDRTVAFYTAIISDCDPFIETNNRVRYVFEENIPDSDSFTSRIFPRIVDLNRLDKRVAIGNNRAPDKRLKITFQNVMLIFLMMTLVLPIALVLNLCGTLYSYWTTRKYRNMFQDDKLPDIVREQLGLSDQLQRYVSNTYQSIIDENNANGTNGDDTDDLRSADGDLQKIRSASLTSRENIELWDNFVEKYTHIGDRDQHWLSEFDRLPLDEKRRQIFRNLSTVEWIRVPMYIKSINAHGGIVARRGINEKTPATSLAGLQFEAKLIKYLLHK